MGNFDMVPSDVMLEIFSRLPAEDVIECKLVSKPWRDIIQHPSFSQKHLNHLNDLDSTHDSVKVSLMLYARRSNKEPFCYTEYDENLNLFTRTTSINYRPPFEIYRILGSINGLICFNVLLDSRRWQPAYICNPITREYLFLPKYEGKNYLYSGFGYVPSTNEYKVVRMYNSKEDSNCNSKEDSNYGIVQVYTLGSGIGWRNAGKMDYDVRPFSTEGVFVNGVIYWANWHATTIVALDLIDEKFGELPLPNCLSAALGELHGICLSKKIELHVLGDFLCVYYHHDGVFDIWVLNKNQSNHDEIWSKEFTRLYVNPVTFTKSGGLLCIDYHDRKVYRYPPKDSSSRNPRKRKLVNFGMIFKIFIGGVCHKNTLVSLKALGEKDTMLMDSGERARCSEGRGSSSH